MEEIKYSKEKVAYHANRDMMLTQELNELEKDHDSI